MTENSGQEYNSDGLSLLTDDNWSDHSSRDDSTMAGLVARYSYPGNGSMDIPSPSLLATDDDLMVNNRRLLTPFQTSVSIIKCAIGAGSFALPYAFYQGGLYISFFLTLFIGAMSAYTIYILGACERKLVHQVLRESYMYDDAAHRIKTKMSYPEVGAAAFPNMVVMINGKGYNVMSIVIYIGIALTSLGVCAAFLDFIANTLPGVLNNWSGAHTFDRGTVTSIVVPVMLCLALLKSFRLLSFTSILGDIAVTAGLITVIAYGASKYGKEASISLPFAKAATLPNFFGSTAFLFAIHIVVLPIMQNMREPRKFRSVVNTSYAFITVINAFFGAASYIFFAPAQCDTGDEKYHGPCGNVLDSMEGGGVLDAVKMLVCIDLLFTVPIVFSAAREIIEDALIAAIFPTYHNAYTTLELREPRGLDTLRFVTRTTLILVVVGIAFGIPDFQNMVGLVGGFVNSLMGFILPPMLYLKAFGQEKGLLWKAVHYAIIVFGVFALIVSTIFTIEAIISG